MPEGLFAGSTADLTNCDQRLAPLASEWKGESEPLYILWGGSSPAQRDLSKARAEAVRDCLSSKGVSTTMIAKDDPNAFKRADINGDDTVNIFDLVMVAGDFGVSVDEP
jgi:hypothetical protein